MRRLTRRLPRTFASLAVMVCVGLLIGSAAKADSFGGVDCEDHPTHPECQLEAGTPGDGSVAPGAGGEVECRQGGEVVPCVTEQGWLHGDGCRYLLIDTDPPSYADEPGGNYLPTCPEDPPGSQRSLVWLADSEAPGPPELGRIAVSRLVLPQPEIELSPPQSAPQLVMLPTWFWVAPHWWVARTASASVPGITVTAVATPTETRWITGDGDTHRCESGTPYANGGDPSAASPDCGHTYSRASAAEPGGVYQLTATVTWSVSWSGGGMSGVVDPLSSTVTVPVEVVESASVNTGGQP